MKSQTVTNFGGNLSFEPKQAFAPRNEAELLNILGECRGRQIRAIGRLHSWSEAPVADDVLIDLRHLNDIRVEFRDGKHWVTAGAGCQIKSLLVELERRCEGTLPSIGLVTEQTIAGAISTGTHGSGTYSMSHFVEEVRVATYDPATNRPVVRTVNSTDELRAARCSLGALGVIVSVSFWSRPQYFIEEHFRRYERIEDVLAAEQDFPLQQLFLLPWLWGYVAQHRRETTIRRRGLPLLYRAYIFLVFDVGLHLLVLLMLRIARSRSNIRFFFRYIAPRMVIQNWNVFSKSQSMLVMEHELFRHIECEVFVKQSRLIEAIGFAIGLVRYFDGDRAAIDSKTRDRLAEIGVLHKLEQGCERYTHHYPVCIRRLLPDDIHISMASGDDEPTYALSFISYARPSERQSFMNFADVLSTAMAALFSGRPHWGKICPLTPAEVARLYPDLPRFREIASRFDPAGAFRNDWVSRTLFEGRSRIPLN